MTIRLVKRKQLLARDEKRSQAPTPAKMALTTQGWIEEFRARKARDQQTLHDVLKRG